MSRPIVIGFVLVLLLSAAFGFGGRPAGDERITPAVTWSGSYSAITDREFHRIHDEATWIELWSRHLGDALRKDSLGFPEAPVIDFDRFMVIAIFRGEAWNVRGERFESLTDQGRHLRLRWDASTYQTIGPDGGGRSVTSYGIWLLPTTDRAMRVEEDTQGLIGHPPVWTERHRFDAR